VQEKYVVIVHGYGVKGFVRDFLCREGGVLCVECLWI